MIKIGIIGGAGYTAGELIRLLVHHPEAELVFVHSESNAGNYLYDVHWGLLGDTSLTFSDSYDLNTIDVLFLCSAHGKSGEFWANNPRPAHLKVVDLAQDFRDESAGYVYGLPEMQREKISQAQLIANPGCFATCIQLGLLPLAAAGLLKSDIDITAITGSTGAGVKPSATSHFSWRNNNISTYKVFTHQHLIEIRRDLGLLQPGFDAQIHFVPVRGDFARGIFASIYTDCPLSEEEAVALYKDYYKDAAFTFVSDKGVDLKQVVNTNKCLVHVEKHEGKLVISSVVDNLLKGASGQALQNMNLICGLPETMGLGLKASAF
ncbi:MAG: N-acetyl-gamma-glutamyl-phosphate reductase [Bacteroidales bacterium]|nr:N-acetyl-gamma-glutamyl-phosphate reductase [Bacteroidales bacterium]MBQ1937622.1 N-acetyl-gamma-glutamyl-phosphate reductase [Bacteroidales bacterium]